VISSFELQKITIANSKPSQLLDSSTFDYDGTIFCSLIVNFDETTSLLLLSFQITTKFFNFPSSSHYNPKHLKTNIRSKN
jgi:hypothetical protein